MNITQILNMVVSEYGNITQKYMMGILLAGMIFALLNCFMGYRLRKVWGTLLGLAIGAVAGGAAAWYYLGGKQSYILIAGALAALFLGMIAWCFYKAGIFILCTGLIYWLASSFISGEDVTSRIICLAVGIVVATMALGYERHVVIVITGLCGGIGAVKCLFELSKMQENAAVWLLGLILGIFGIVIQAGPYLRKQSRERGFSSDRFSDRRKRSPRSFSLPTLPSLPSRKKKKKKTVYQTNNKVVTKQDNKTANKKKGNPNRKGISKGEDSSYRRNRNQREDEPKEQEQKNSYSNYEPHSVVDLDDLNRELSQEIRKIYEPREKK